MKCILAIGGSDSCGGAGIQADIKTITSLRAHALTVLTAVTAQNSLGVVAVHKVPVGFISRQLETVIDDVVPRAVKVGMLYCGAAVKEVARVIKTYKLRHVVVDPILRASTGNRLLEAKAISLLKEVLLPLANVVTPNLYEAGFFVGRKVENLEEMVEAAKVIKVMGPDVVITGGHLRGGSIDLLYDGKDFHQFGGPRIDAIHTHGSGCVFSTALATFLANDNDVITATKLAHDHTVRAIKYGYACGRGAGTVQAGLACNPHSR